MKLWKSLLAIAAALGICAGAVMPMIGAAQTTYSLASHAEDVKIVGRCAVTDKGVEAYTTGAGIAFYVDGGADVAVTITGTSSKWDCQCFSVFVDGVEQERIVLRHPINQWVTQTVTVASGLSDGVHRIEVYRDTEEVFAQCRFDEIVTDGEISPVPATPLKMEFVGDSITCGYAAYPVEDTSTSVEYPLWEAGSRTSAYLTAKALGADYQSVCASGYGIVCGWNSDGVTLSDMYEKHSRYYNDTAWNFADQADIVVINLGTNDNVRMSACGKTTDDVSEGIRALLEQVRRCNPNAKIVWVTGMMGTCFSSQVTAHMEELGGEAAGYYFKELPYGASSDGNHPDLAEHQAAAAVLTEFLKTNVLDASYADSLMTVEEAQAIADGDGVSESKAAKIALEIAIASKSEAMTGMLTAVCNMIEDTPAPQTTTTAPTTTVTSADTTVTTVDQTTTVTVTTATTAATGKATDDNMTPSKATDDNITPSKATDDNVAPPADTSDSSAALAAVIVALIAAVTVAIVVIKKKTV